MKKLFLSSIIISFSFLILIGPAFAATDPPSILGYIKGVNYPFGTTANYLTNSKNLTLYGLSAKPGSTVTLFDMHTTCTAPSAVNVPASTNVKVSVAAPSNLKDKIASFNKSLSTRILPGESLVALLVS